MNPALIKAIGAVLVAALAFAAGWTANGWRLGADIALTAKSQAEADLTAERGAREKERQHDQKIAGIEAEAKEANARAVAAGRRADAAAAGVRAPAYAAGQAACIAATAASGTPAGPPDVVPGELYRWADDRAGELAKAFDGARTAGLTCQSTYGAVSE